MLKEIIARDKELLLYFNNLGSEAFDGLWLFITNPLSSISIYIFLLYLCFKYFHWKKVLLILIFVALIILVTDQTANLFKHGFERLRPCHDPSLIPQMRMVICGGMYGFFSGHAANTIAIATFFTLVLCKHVKWIAYLLFPWSLIISYSRIYLGVHFPGDVTVGLLMGILMSSIFYVFFVRINQRVHLPEKNTQI